MPQDPSQPDISAPILDQDQSRAALGTITYLMTHLLPKAQMQSQAQPNQQIQQQEQKAESKPKKQEPDHTAELKGQMDAMKTENDAKIQSLVDNQQKQIDELKQTIQKILEEDQNEPQPPAQAPANP